MVIKIKQGRDDLHSNNIMYEDSATAKVVDGFFGISTKQEKPDAPDTASLQETEEQKAKEKADVAAPAQKETQKPSEYEDNSTTNTDKSEEKKSFNVWIAQMWKEIAVKARSYSSDFQSYTNIAIPIKFENGVLTFEVPSLFAKEAIENNYLDSITQELNTISGGAVRQIAVQCASDVENPFYVRINIALLKDKRITNADFRVYSILLTYYNNKTKECSTGARKIFKDFGISTSTTQTSIKKLEECGYIRFESQNNTKNITFPFLEKIRCSKWR